MDATTGCYVIATGSFEKGIELFGPFTAEEAAREFDEYCVPREIIKVQATWFPEPEDEDDE